MRQDACEPAPSKANTSYQMNKNELRGATRHGGGEAMPSVAETVVSMPTQNPEYSNDQRQDATTNYAQNARRDSPK